MDDTGIIELFWQRSEDALTECKTKFGGYCRMIAAASTPSSSPAHMPVVINPKPLSIVF